MAHFLAALCVPHHTQNFHVPVDLIFQRVEIRVLLSSLDFDLALLLMCLSIKFPHGFGGILSDAELCSELFFLIFQELNFLFALIHHSLLTTEFLFWFLVIALFLL